MVEEIWRDIKGYEGLYQVSNLGRVKSLFKYKKTLKIKIKNNGYCEVCLYKNKAQHYKLVHRLVAEAFIPNPENKPCIDHINSVRSDNTVWLNKDGSVNYEKTNLRWCTQKENLNNPITLGRMSANCKFRDIVKLGGEHRNAKSVLQFDLNGEIIKKWDSIADAEREYGNHRRIQGCLSESSRRKTAYNCKWEYYNTDRYLIAIMDKTLKMRKGVA